MIQITSFAVDEIDPQFNAIKGGGGALYREKVVAEPEQAALDALDEFDFDDL